MKCVLTVPMSLLIGIVFLQFMTEPAIGASDYRDRYEQDIGMILTSRYSLQSLVKFVEARPGIFPPVRVEPGEIKLNREQRMVVWQTWQQFLDHVLFFDTMGQLYADLYREAAVPEDRENTFLAAFACFLAQYKYAIDYINRMENNPAMHVLLNQRVPELGLAEDIYARMKYRFLNVLRGAEFARLNALYLLYRKERDSPLQEAIEGDIARIWEAGKGRGPVLTAQNALQVVRDLGFTVWFPVQKNVAALMGDIKVWRPGVSLITRDQIRNLREKLRPGDILLQRREWFATNIGIPGYWTHAALYIGSPWERSRYFAGPGLAEWLTKMGSSGGTLDSLLRSRYPEQYQLSVTPQEENHIPRVVEAIAPGVSFTTLEHSASADSMVVLRPNLPRREIARAILRAFHYSGRPYDFNFDFRTDSELVCSELIYKAYEPAGDSPGLSLPLTEVLERPLLSPNEIARIFAEEYGKEDSQFTFIAFLDGTEKEQQAMISDVESFLESWKRPKWHVWLQEAEESR